MTDAEYQARCDSVLHLGFRVSGRETWQHGTVCDDFEILAAARDCARLLDARGWVDVKLIELRDDLVMAERVELGLEWRETV